MRTAAFVFSAYRRLFCTIMLLLISVLLYAQTEEIKPDITKVKPGMSERELVKVAGNPVRKESFKTLKIGTNDTTTYWLYEKNITVVLHNHYVQAVERDRSLILFKLQEWADPKNKDGIKLIYGK